MPQEQRGFSHELPPRGAVGDIEIIGQNTYNRPGIGIYEGYSEYAGQQHV